MKIFKFFHAICTTHLDLKFLYLIATNLYKSGNCCLNFNVSFQQVIPFHASFVFLKMSLPSFLIIRACDFLIWVDLSLGSEYIYIYWNDYKFQIKNNLDVMVEAIDGEELPWLSMIPLLIHSRIRHAIPTWIKFKCLRFQFLIYVRSEPVWCLCFI